MPRSKSNNMRDCHPILRAAIPSLRSLGFQGTLCILLTPMVFAQTSIGTTSDNISARSPDNISARSPGIVRGLDDEPWRRGFTEPIRTLHLAVAEAGRVDSVDVRRGQRVTAGQPLMQLDRRVLEASLAIAQSEAEDDSSVEALRVRMLQKSLRLESLREIYDQGAGSAEEFRQAESESEVARFEWLAATERQRRAEMQVTKLRGQWERQGVTAPMDGVITEVRCEVGEYVSTAEPHVLTLVRLEQLKTTFFVPTDFASRWREGQTVSLQIGSDHPETRSATIEHVSPVTLADSGRVRIDVVLDNADGQIRSGVSARWAVAPTRPSMTSTGGGFRR